MDEIKLHTKFYSGKDVHDLIIRHLSNDYHAALAAIRELSNIPASDVVEVVRCKDCKMWGRTLTEEERQFCIDTNTDLVCGVWTSDGLMPNDYCSQGERKEGQQ